MAVKVRIPAPLRKITNNQTVVESEGETIEEVIESLEKKFPGLKERVCDETGQIRRFINIFVDGEDIRFKEGIKTQLKQNSEVSIIPAIAGGYLSKNFL